MQHVAVCCWALQVQVAALNAETGTVVVCGSNFTAREYDRNLCVVLSGTLVGTLVADATLLLEQVALPQQMAQHCNCQPGLQQLAAGSWLAKAWRLACLSCSATHRHEACAVRPICPESVQPVGVDVMCHINSRAPAVCWHRCVIQNVDAQRVLCAACEAIQSIMACCEASRPTQQ